MAAPVVVAVVLLLIVVVNVFAWALFTAASDADDVLEAEERARAKRRGEGLVARSQRAPAEPLTRREDRP